MLNLQSSPKDDLGFSQLRLFLVLPFLSQASSLNTLKSPDTFLRHVEQAVTCFSGPPRHHVLPQPQPQCLPRALLEAEFVFVSDDASKLPLPPVFGGFFVLQIGDKSDSLSLDRLKPVISAVPVTPAVPPP